MKNEGKVAYIDLSEGFIRTSGVLHRGFFSGSHSGGRLSRCVYVNPGGSFFRCSSSRSSTGNGGSGRCDGFGWSLCCGHN